MSIVRRLTPFALTILAACASNTAPEVASKSNGLYWENPVSIEAACTTAKEKINGMRTALKAETTPRTVDGTLKGHNELLRAIDDIAGITGLIANVHPEKGAREAAEKCEREIEQLVNEISLDPGLYQAVAGVDLNGADAHTKRFTEKVLRDFRRSGVDKDEATRTKLKKIYEEMVEVGQTFGRNIREDVRTLEIDSAEQLAGLPDDFIKAHAPGKDGKIVLTTNYPDFFPVQRYAESEALRRDLFMKFAQRGTPANDKVLLKLLQLRREYANTLGHETWAAYMAEDKMVKKAEAIETFIADITAIAKPRMNADLETLLVRKKKDNDKSERIMAWDRFYYVNKVQAEQYGFDARAVRPYFEFNKVTEGLMSLYGSLFGVQFEEASAEELPRWHSSVKAYRMKSGADLIGVFYLDMHPREGKYGHAAMFPIKVGLEDGQVPVAALVCNFPDPTKSEGPALMEHSQVVTYFHEFGHLVHHLLARGSPWMNLSGINVEWDFVEAPSQLLEEWAWDAKVLAGFAKHVETGEAIPADTVKKMRDSSEFGKGVHVMRQVYYTALSYFLHSQDPKALDLLAATKKIQTEYSPYPYVEGTFIYASFGHLNGYSSMYYTYQWSLSLAKDIFTRFASAGLLDESTARAYRKLILEPGGSQDAAQLVEQFLGRPHNLDAYKAWLERKAN